MKKLVMLILMTALVVCASGCAGGVAPEPATSSPAAETSADVPPAEAETSEQPTPATTTEQSQGGAAGEETAGKQWKVAVVVKNETNPYFITLIEAVKFAEEEIGNVKVDVLSSQSDKEIEQQVQMLDTLLTQDYDLIAFTPISDSAVIPWIVRANAQGVPVINFDSVIDDAQLEEAGAKVISKIFMDHFIVGQVAGEAMGEALNSKGKIIVLEGTAGASSAEKRKDGFYDVMKKYPDIEVLASEDCKFNRNDAYNAMASIISAYPNIYGVYACSDEMILGALAAIEEVGMDPTQMVLIGANFTEEVWEPMAEGKVYGSPTNEPAFCGYGTVHIAVDYLEGYPIDKEYVTETKMTYKKDIPNAESLFRPLVWERQPKE